MEETIQRWNCLYPLYFDAGKSLADGRKVQKQQAIQKPTIQQLSMACDLLQLEYVVEAKKRHPRDPYVFGRLRVQLKDGESLVRDDIPNVRTLIKMVAIKLPETISKLPEKETSTGRTPSGIQSTTTGGVTLVPRIKKKSKRK